MTFADVEREYKRLRISYINEVINREEFLDYLDYVLMIKDDRGVLWKKDIEGNWLYFDSEKNEWLIGERQEESIDQEYSVSIKAPQAPVIPKEVLEQEKKSEEQLEVLEEEKNSTEEQVEVLEEEKEPKEEQLEVLKEEKKSTEEQLEVLEKKEIFIEQQSKESKSMEDVEIKEKLNKPEKIRFCTGCGEKLKSNQKFCTNCGKKV